MFTNKCIYSQVELSIINECFIDNCFQQETKQNTCDQCFLFYFLIGCHILRNVFSRMICVVMRNVEKSLLRSFFRHNSVYLQEMHSCPRRCFRLCIKKFSQQISWPSSKVKSSHPSNLSINMSVNQSVPFIYLISLQDTKSPSYT